MRSAATSSRTEMGPAGPRAARSTKSEGVTATVIGRSPEIRKRCGRGGRVEAGEERADRAETEIRQQRPQAGFGLVEIPIVTESREPSGMQPRLVGIDLPRMQVEHRGPVLQRVA